MTIQPHIARKLTILGIVVAITLAVVVLFVLGKDDAAREMLMWGGGSMSGLMVILGGVWPKGGGGARGGSGASSTVLALLSALMVLPACGCATVHTFEGKALELNLKPTAPAVATLTVDGAKVAVGKAVQAADFSVTCPEGTRHAWLGEGRTKQVDCTPDISAEPEAYGASTGDPGAAGNTDSPPPGDGP